MNDHRAETIELIEQHGSFLLIRAGPVLQWSKSAPAMFTR
jgi:hypothetical protein